MFVYFPNFFDILLVDDPKLVQKLIDVAFRRGGDGIFNGFYNKMMEKREMIKWNLYVWIEQYTYDAKTPIDYLKKIYQFTLKEIGEQISQLVEKITIW